jgi:hypothetical protein
MAELLRRLRVVPEWSGLLLSNHSHFTFRPRTPLQCEASLETRQAANPPTCSSSLRLLRSRTKSHSILLAGLLLETKDVEFVKRERTEPEQNKQNYSRRDFEAGAEAETPETAGETLRLTRRSRSPRPTSRPSPSASRGNNSCKTSGLPGLSSGFHS